MMEWKTKPVVVQAVQWTGENVAELEELGIRGGLGKTYIGHYAVKNEKGKFEILPAEVFYARYERHLTWDENL